MSALTKCNNVDEYGLSKIPPGLLQYRVKVEDMANIELEKNINFNDIFNENLIELLSFINNLNSLDDSENIKYLFHKTICKSS